MSVEKIHTELGKVTSAMKQLVPQYKKAKGTPKEKSIVDKLKILTKRKNELMAQYEKEIEKLDADAELELDEINFKDFFSKLNEGTFNISMPSAVEASAFGKLLNKSGLEYDRGVGPGPGVIFQIYDINKSERDKIINILKRNRMHWKIPDEYNLDRIKTEHNNGR